MIKEAVEQLDLFAPGENIDPVAFHRQSWAVCWGWAGPEAGGFCTINSICADLETPYTTDWGKFLTSIYCYTERCRLIELRPDGRWLAVIEMGIVHGEPWGKDGTRLILSERDIWPPVRDIRENR